MNFALLLTCFLYLLSAMSVTIVRQYLSYYGVSDEDTLMLGQGKKKKKILILSFLVTFLAYAFSGTPFFASKPTEEKKTKQKKESAIVYIIIYSIAGLTGNLLCNIGMFFK